MVLTDYLKIKTYLTNCDKGTIVLFRKYHMLMLLGFVTISFLRKEISPQGVIQEHQQDLFHNHGRSTYQSCSLHPDPFIITIKQNLDKIQN